jgi:hypothetical protein
MGKGWRGIKGQALGEKLKMPRLRAWEDTAGDYTCFDLRLGEDSSCPGDDDFVGESDLTTYELKLISDKKSSIVALAWRHLLETTFH